MAKATREPSRDFEATLWATADKLRGTLDAAEYKHVVLGLIFLKYISDAFEERRADEDKPGFCKSATLEEVRQHNWVLTPGRYVGAAEAEDDGAGFEDKMRSLVATLEDEFKESAKLEKAIRANLAGLGFAKKGIE